jgi:hypothetical protein
MSNDFERFKALVEQPSEQAPELPTPSKGGNGPRFAAVETPVQHVPGTLEAIAPKDHAKRPGKTKGRCVAPAVLPEPMQTDPEVLARLIAFAIEREAIRTRREAGQAWPWTQDPILAAGRFCNIRREDDRVSRWVMANVIEPNRSDPDLWHKIVIARCVNEPDALAELDWSQPFDPQAVRGVLEARQARGEKVYRTDAYKLPLPPRELAGMSITAYNVDYVWGPLWRDREALRPQIGETLASFADRLRDCEGLGPFRAGQVIADLKHAAPLDAAADWWSFAVPGPGSERGLNRVCGRSLKASWPEWHWQLELMRLADQVCAAFEAAGLPPLDMQNLQNVLCEFDKYERAREQGGKPSRKYQAADSARQPKAKRAKKAALFAADVAPELPLDAPEPIEAPKQEPPHCLAAALSYAAKGWRVFPAHIAPDKKGMLAKKSHKSAEFSGGVPWGATNDPEQIKRDFAKWPEALIGLPTGPDNGFFVLEADTKEGGHKHDGLAALNALMSQHGLLPETRMAVSPSGSWHYYFQWPHGLNVRNSMSQIGKGLDVRGDGGMVIAPPSKRGDGAYRWVCEAGIAEAPPWLLALVATAEAPKADKPRGEINIEALEPLCLIKAALDAIPILGMDYQQWIDIGMAVHAASGGSAEGLALFDAWTQAAPEYDVEGLADKWRSFKPDRIGFDYLASEAHKIDPEWRRKAAKNDTTNGSANDNGGLSDELISVCAADIEIEALEWLWPGRFARGKLGIIAGLPDEGKGLLTAFMAACVTNPDRAWPCNEGKAPQGNVILFTAEDDLADTVVPRLIAAGADLAHVHIIKLVLDTDKRGKRRHRMFNLARDLDMLRTKLAAIGDVALIVIDPVSAYFGPSREIDSFRDTDVRSVLAPLQELAGEAGAAVVGLMHFNKKVDVLNMLLRICNSIAFAAASRHAYGVVHDPETKRQLLVRGKNNLAKRDDRALAFRIEAREIGRSKRSGNAIEAPFLIWEAEHVEITATEALQAVDNRKKAPTARGNAKQFLQEMLCDGPVSQTKIEKASKAAGIAEATLNRAKNDLGIVATKDGPLSDKGLKTWRWHLPAKTQE